MIVVLKPPSPTEVARRLVERWERSFDRAVPAPSDMSRLARRIAAVIRKERRTHGNLGAMLGRLETLERRQHGREDRARKERR